MRKMIVILMGLSLLAVATASAETVTFEDLSLSPESYYIGSDAAGGYESNGVEFNTYYDDTFGPYWEGFAYSNTTDTTTAGFTNQYSAITGGGKDGSQIYGVGYIGFMGIKPTITFSEEVLVRSMYITNTTYAYLSMRDGDFVAKKFGGQDGSDPDWFLLTITGKDEEGQVVGTVSFYLADFRSDDPAQDYIVDEWTEVDTSSLPRVQTLEFSLSSSDVGDFGMNTPAYFAIDSIYNAEDGDQDDYPCFIKIIGE